MSYNIPEDERPQANKKAQEGLNILASDVDNTLNRVKNLQSETIIDAYNRPMDEPMARTLSPLEQYAYEPQPVPELGSITEPMARESIIVPQEQPKVLSNFVNQYEAVPQRDMVSVTPYEQAVVDLRDDEVNSLRNDAGEISSSSLEVFSKPLDANKIKILGLADENMKPTKKGELFYNLTNMGMFNEDGTITEKGLAYMTPLKEMAAPEWITQPGNMEKFDLLWQDGVIRSSSTPTEILGAVTKFAGDVVYGAGELAQQQALGLAYNSRTWGGLLGLEDNRPAALKAQSEVSELSVMENVYKNVVGLITMVDVGLATDKKLFEDYVASPIGAAYEKITGDEFPELRATDRSNPNVKDSEDALVAARHKQWAANQRLADMEAGEIAETFLGIENSVKQAESLKKEIGNDEFKKIYGGVGAFSSVVLDPTNAVPAAFAVKAARSAPLTTRAMLNAQNTMGKVAAMELAIAQGDVAVQAARAKLAKVEPTVGLAKRMAESFAERAKVQPSLVEKSQTAANIARRISDEADQIRSALPTITQELEGLVAKRNSLATRIPEAYSQKILQTMEIGRQARSLPAKALGATLEGVGDTISKADTAITNFLQERGLDQIYTAAVGAAGVVGMAGSPVIGTVAAGAAALKSGKVLSSYGKLFRYVGKEMENVRGQIPFWKRVAAHTAPGSLGRGIAHTFNTFDLGGVTSDTLRRTARGVAAALPTDFMFEYLSDGADMRPETLYQAGAESLVIGGSFAAAGGAFMGTKKRMRELSIGDELNFRQNMTDPRQRALFQAIPSSTRRAISTYAIANPTLKYVFKDSGASKYDPNTNTASINVNSTNPIKALVAHETLHHTIIKNNMEAGIAALFLGDTKTNSAGGLFRSKDGTFDPNFEAFKTAYYKRLGAEGMTNAERNAIYPIEKIAVEYFIEKHSDQYASMAESGALGAVASSGAARRKLGSILETVLPRVPVLKDLHFKSGGMIDANGSWVTGNGILDIGGVRRDPITSKMFREMNRRSSGLSPGQFDPLMSDKPDSGAPILLDPSSGIDMELLHPLINVDANGKPILQNGKPVALDRATELSRALGGLTAIEVMQRKRADNYAPEKGEAHIDSEGEFQPGWLSNDVITEMFAKNNYNSEQKRIIREMNRLIKKGTGERVVMINFAATGRNRAGKVVYKPQEATLRDTVPVAVTISKAGNVLFGLMSVTKLNENIQKRSQSKRGKKLYGGNVDLILQDTQAMMEFHKNGTDSIEYFKKYGAVEADERKKFINTMFGLLNKKEQAVLNPMLLEDDVKSRDNVYRTYRADRVSKAVPMSPEEYPAMPFSYESVSQVRMPEQARQMPESLDADYMKAVESGDVDAQQRMVDEVAKAAGYTLSHRRRKPLTNDGTDFVVQLTENWEANENYGDNHYVVKPESLPDVPDWAVDWYANSEMMQDWADIQGLDPKEDFDEIRSAAEESMNPSNIVDSADFWDSAEDVSKFWEENERKRLAPAGIVGFKTPDGGVIFDAYSANRKGLLKSADPVTRDDSGNVIPLSQRFNEKSGDIRYMPEPLPEDYRGEHTAPGPEGAPASDLTGGGVYPSDVYSRPDWYEQDEGLAEMRKIARLKGNPEAPVWIHRAVPADVAKKAMKSDYPLGYIFRSGDWVTTNKQYAKDHGESVFKGNYEVFSKRVKAKDIHTNGDSIFEWGYNPESPEVTSNKSSNIRYMPEPVSSPAKKKKEIVEQEDKGIQAPTGSLGELRSNVEIKKSNLPADTLSVPKFVARENKDSDWKVMEGPLRIARGNYFTPLPNIKIKKTNEFSVQNQNLVQNAFLAKAKTPTDPKALREQQNAIRNTNASLDKIGLAVRDIEADPQKFVDPKGYAEVMKKAGVTGDVLIPPSSLKMMLEDPDAFTALLSGGYHGDKTVAGIRESAMSGLDSVVEMRELIGGRPPDLVTAIHHLWGTLSKQLPPLQQEALWMRMITNKEVMQQIGESINGTFSQSPSQWKDTVKKARINTVGNYGKLGNNATSNANSFYLMLYRHNGKWGEVSDVYKNNDAVQMRYDFNTLGHGATGIKNKVQSFIGLTFGIKGNVLDRWRFVDMYLADAMKITGAKTPRDYFKYEGKGKNVPVDKIGIYKNYGTIENKSPLFSLAMYSGMDRVSQAAIDASPSLKALLGNHADPGGLHWLSWNAIKNEAVGHSSLDITKNFIKAYNQDGKFDKLTVDNFLKFVNSTEAFVEGTSGGGEEITRLTLKNGVFNYTKK